MIAVSIIDFTDASRHPHTPTQFRRLRLRYHVEKVARRLQELRKRRDVLQFPKERRQLQRALLLLLHNFAAIVGQFENLLVERDRFTRVFLPQEARPFKLRFVVYTSQDEAVLHPSRRNSDDNKHVTQHYSI